MEPTDLRRIHLHGVDASYLLVQALSGDDFEDLCQKYKPGKLGAQENATYSRRLGGGLRMSRPFWLLQPGAVKQLTASSDWIVRAVNNKASKGTLMRDERY